MKKILFILSISISFLFGNSPTSVIQKCINALQNSDFRQALTYVDVPDNINIKVKGKSINFGDFMNYETMLAQAKAQIDANGGIKDIKILDEKINKDKAVVKIQGTYKNKVKSIDVNLIKQNNTWKIKPF